MGLEPHRNPERIYINTLIGNTKNPLGVAGIGLKTFTLTKKWQLSNETGGKYRVIDKNGTIQISPNSKELGHNLQSIIGEKEMVNLLNNQKKQRVHYFFNQNHHLGIYGHWPLLENHWILVYTGPSPHKTYLTPRWIAALAILLTIIVFLLIYNSTNNQFIRPYQQTLEDFRNSNQKFSQTIQGLKHNLEQQTKANQQKTQTNQQLQQSLQDLQQKQIEDDSFHNDLLQTLQTSKRGFANYQIETLPLVEGNSYLVDEFSLANKPILFFMIASVHADSFRSRQTMIFLLTAIHILIADSKQNPPTTIPTFLKNTFRQLHRLFLGRMENLQTNMTMGIIEQSNGLVYQINANHPSAILYRNQRAMKVNKNSYHSYLGDTKMDLQKIYLRKFPLQKNDQLLFHSYTHPNKDILHIIEKTDARPAAIQEHLSSDTNPNTSLLKIIRRTD